MSVKNNKTTMIDEYINNNLDMLINSKKTLEELCENFNKNNDKKVSFSSFYKSFKQISKDKGLTKKRTRKTKKEMQEISQKEAKQLLEDLETEQEEERQEQKTNIDLNNFDKLKINNQKKIYGIERYLNKYQAQTFEISKDFPNTHKYSLIVDMDKCFRVNDILYAPIVCILSKSNIFTNEEYNEHFKTSHPTKQNKYINVIRMKTGIYKYRFYVVNYYDDNKDIKPFCKTSYKEYEDITELIKYEGETKKETEEETEEEEEE